MGHTKQWWFLLPNKNKKPLNLIFNNILHNYLKKDTASSTSKIKSQNLKVFKWKEGVNWELPKSSNNKFSLSIWKGQT